MKETDADVEAEPVDLLHELAGVAVAATPEARNRAATDLADRLVVRAESDDVAALTALLRGNPRREATVWRALQFRLGDVSPSSDAPHDNPCSAVLAVARAADGSHVASELVAVDADGSAWTALVRTDDELVVQVPSPRTLVGPVSAPDAVGPLLLAWRAALGGMRVEGAKPDEDQPAATAAVGADEPAVTEPARGDEEAAAPTDVGGPGAAGADRTQADAVARALQDVRDELQAIRDQLARLEKHLTG